MPAAQRDAAAEFAATHVPSAVFFDIDRHSDHSTDLPHMLPTPQAFATAVGALGIGNQHAVVVYDAAGLFSAARLWWMFRVFGHCNVAVLDGGLPKWRAENRVTESGKPQPAAANFTATYNPALLRDKAAVSATSAVVLDARSAPRFAGAVPEPRAGLRSGHIPRSRNLPYTSLLAPDGSLLPKPELLQRLSPAQDKPVISTCGSGVTACILDLALEHIGHRDHAVYDGSWAEWGADPACPIATGTED